MAKFQNFCSNIDLCTNKPDIIALTETWLEDDNCDALYSIEGYTIYRSDRSADTSHKQAGGGCLIAVSNSLTSAPIVLNNHGVEHLFIKVTNNTAKFIVGTAYLSPSCSINKYIVHAEIVESLVSRFSNFKMLLVGDYNLAGINWSTDDILYYDVTTGTSRDIIDKAAQIGNTFGALHFNQLHPILVTHKGYTLDLCFTNFEKVIFEKPLEALSKVDEHHPPSIFVVSVKCNESLKVCEKFRNFRKANYDGINSELANIDWHSTFSGLDCESKVGKLHEILNTQIERHVPILNKTPQDYPSWFSHDLKAAIFKKNRAHWIYKLSQLEADYIEFKRLRAICVRLRRLCYSVYLENVESSIKYNLKSFWSFVKTKRRKLDIPSSVYLGNTETEEGDEIVELFARHFKSSFTRSNPIIPPLKHTPILVHDIRITRGELIDALNNMKKSTGYGPDQIPALFIYQCSNYLIDPLLDIFNSSLSTGVFPSMWKSSYIRPLHKKGSINNVQNYRPITTISALSKLFDSIVTVKLSGILHPQISIKQHGFMPNRSTESNLASFTNFISESLSNYGQVDAFFSDFSKAFDSVNHDLLIRKLENYGVRGNMLKWTQSYLTGRSAQVKIKNHISESFEIQSGVPQGSHLGPLLFILFINDITEVIKYSEILLFADDAKLYKNIVCQADCVELQSDIVAIAVWCARNALELNIGKCNVMNFCNNHRLVQFQYKLGNAALNNVKSIKDLGVMLDSNLSFKDHVSYICSKAVRVIGFIKKFTSDFKSSSVILYLYNTLVLPILMYASPIWSPHLGCDQDRLETVQHKFLRYLSFKNGQPMDPFSHDYSSIMSLFKVPSLKSNRESRDAILAFKLINEWVDCEYLCNVFKPRELTHNIRNPRTYEVERYTSNYILHSTKPRLIRTWNELPNCIQSTTDLPAFKDLVKKETFKYF